MFFSCYRRNDHNHQDHSFHNWPWDLFVLSWVRTFLFVHIFLVVANKQFIRSQKGLSRATMMMTRRHNTDNSLYIYVLLGGLGSCPSLHQTLYYTIVFMVQRWCWGASLPVAMSGCCQSLVTPPPLSSSASSCSSSSSSSTPSSSKQTHNLYYNYQQFFSRPL